MKTTCKNQTYKKIYIVFVFYKRIREKDNSHSYRLSNKKNTPISKNNINQHPSKNPKLAIFLNS